MNTGRPFRFFGRFLLFLAGAVILCEIWFRWVTPACNFPYAFSDPVTNILRYDPNRLDHGVYTVGRLAQQRGKWRINNYGWNSPINYLPAGKRTKPLIAMFGDSYLEAFHVDVDSSIAGLLRDRLKDDYDLYQFGVSGASLATYLSMTRWVDKEFQPDLLIYLINNDDLEQSLKEIRGDPYSLQVKYANGFVFEEEPSMYRPNKFRRFFRPLAIVRYLWANAHWTSFFFQGDFDALTAPAAPDVVNPSAFELPGGGGNLPVEGMAPRSPVSSRLVFDPLRSDHWLIPWHRLVVFQTADYLIDQIRSINRKTPIVFMIDGRRDGIYHGHPDQSERADTYRELAELTAKYGCGYLDLTAPFDSLYRATGKPFNSPYEWHWNEYGHQAAADALYKYLTEQRLITVPN